MIDAVCRTNEDDYKNEKWPTRFVCPPNKEDRVMAQSGRILWVASITFGEREDKSYKEIRQESILVPFVEIELYKKRY